VFRHEYVIRILRPACFMSHLDRVRFFGRLFRRAELPVAMTEGFNPRYRFAMPVALGVGQESEGEILEVDYEQFVRPAEAIRDMEPYLLDGIQFVGGKLTGTQRHVRIESLVYRIRFLAPLEGLDVGRTLSADRIPFQMKRKGSIREQDVRPLIGDLAVEEGALVARLPMTERGTLKVTELLLVLGLQLAPDQYRVRRRLVKGADS